MSNIYLIFGDESYLINKELKKIIDNSNVISDNIIRYNLDEVNVSLALEEASTISMFDSKKLIICEECTFLTGENKKEINHDIDSLIRYINNPFDDVYLVFIVQKEKLDDRKKIVKELKKLSTIIECKRRESHNLNNYIESYFKENGYSISRDSVIFMINKAGENLSNLINEADKLMIYKDSDKNISKEDVDNLICKSIEDDIFKLTNSIMNKDKENIVNIYKDLLLKGEEPIKLIVLIANQLRLILQVKLMIRNGYKEREMANIIGEHPYRVKLAVSSIFTINELKNYLTELHNLDLNIKTGKIDKNFGLEMFLLSIK